VKKKAVVSFTKLAGQERVIGIGANHLAFLVKIMNRLFILISMKQKQFVHSLVNDYQLTPNGHLQLFWSNANLLHSHLLKVKDIPMPTVTPPRIRIA
jgi:hypothetical protein